MYSKIIILNPEQNKHAISSLIIFTDCIMSYLKGFHCSNKKYKCVPVRLIRLFNKNGSNRDIYS